MKIAIITDGNNTLGMGHVSQSLTLAQYIKEKLTDLDTLFFITKSEKYVIDMISKSGNKVIKFDTDDEIFDFLTHENPDKIIFDKLDVSPLLAKNIKEKLKSKLIICTNLTEANDSADVTVLADIGSNFKNIINKKKVGKTQYFGPKYWILRPAFYFYNELKKSPPKEVKNILLIFGGADPENYSSLVLKQFIEMEVDYNITLVLGSAFNNHEELDLIKEQCLTTKLELTTLQNVSNVAELMYNNDLVMASPGLSFFEALVVGTPVIGFHQNELQKDVYNEVLPTLGKKDIVNLETVLKNKIFVSPQDPIIVEMQIGLGKDQIISEIIN